MKRSQYDAAGSMIRYQLDDLEEFNTKHGCKPTGGLKRRAGLIAHNTLGLLTEGKPPKNNNKGIDNPKEGKETKTAGIKANKDPNRSNSKPRILGQHDISEFHIGNEKEILEKAKGMEVFLFDKDSGIIVDYLIPKNDFWLKYVKYACEKAARFEKMIENGEEEKVKEECRKDSERRGRSKPSECTYHIQNSEGNSLIEIKIDWKSKKIKIDYNSETLRKYFYSPVYEMNFSDRRIMEKHKKIVEKYIKRPRNIEALDEMMNIFEKSIGEKIKDIMNIIGEEMTLTILQENYCEL